MADFLSVLVPVLSLIVVWFFGHSAGKDKGKAEERHNRQKEVVDAIRVAREIERTANDLSDDDIVERLRERAKANTR